MNVDLSRKSICELRFDRAAASAEEALVASRVQALVAHHNKIRRIVGLGQLFTHLQRLDLSFNNLGSPRGRGAAACLTALPPSLQSLSLAHNSLRGFSINNSDTNNNNNRNNIGSSDQVRGEVEGTLMRLRQTCPVTLAIFFNRDRFPHLRELDLSHNALQLSLDESDTIEEIWQEHVERPTSLAETLSHNKNNNNNEYTLWHRCTTSAIEILRLDGNSQLSALNGVLCGMESLTHIYCTSSGVTDLTGISAAATLCPKLYFIDMRGSAVVEAFMHAPPSTIATFIELLLLPSLLEGETQWEGNRDIIINNNNNKEENEERRTILQRIVREIAQNHVKDIENIISLHSEGCNKSLPQVLYAALLQQVIPQVTELDDSVDVNAARREFMNAAHEVLQQFIDNKNRISLIGQKKELISPCKEKEDQEIKEYVYYPPKKKDIEKNMDISYTTTNNSSSISLPEKPRKSSPVERKNHSIISNLNSVNEPNIKYKKRERSRSTHGITIAAAAAAISTQLRPAVLVRSTSTNNNINSIENTNNNSNNKGNDFTAGISSIHETSSINSSLGILEGNKNLLHNDRNRNKSISSNNNDDSYTSPTPNYISKVMQSPSENKKIFKKNNSGGSKFQRALAALTPLLMQRLRAEGLNENKNYLNNYTHSLSNDNEVNNNDNGNNNYNYNYNTQRDYNNYATSITTSTSNNTSLVRESLIQQAHSLEIALIASQDRQRTIQEDILQLKTQLQLDRHLIIDQRKEAARLREELEILSNSNKRTRIKLKKRQKEIAYGAAALQRREGIARRQAELENIKKEEKSLQQAERRLREKIALSGIWSNSQHEKMQISKVSGNIEDIAYSNENTLEQIQTLRKTRADILRENAIRERMEAMQKEEPLAYNARKFRLGEYHYNNNYSDENNNNNNNNIINENKSEIVSDRIEVDNRIHGKTPWRKGNRSPSVSSETITDVEIHKSLYDKGYSPYSDNNNNNEVEYQHPWLQELSLQELFEKASAIRQKQHFLQQRMREVEGDVDIFSQNDEIEEHYMMNFHNNNNNNNNNVNADAISTSHGKQTPSTCVAMIEERKGPASFMTIVEDSSLSNYTAANNFLNKNTIVNRKNENKNDDKSVNDDDDSVDVVVSVTESLPDGDFMIAAASLSKDENEQFTELIKKEQKEEEEEKKRENKQINGFPPHTFSSTSSSSIPTIPAAEEHFSVDARSIYAEILRQRQQQQIQTQIQQKEQFSNEKELKQNSGVVFCKTGKEVEEPSPVLEPIESIPSSDDKRVNSDIMNHKEKSESSVSNNNINNDSDNGTRRALFA